ncbi:hypothetical protein Btru_008942 [Bulinus truncatus]|nr:hypothetical protein Btru_008942 [Bulinus truncatus]
MNNRKRHKSADPNAFCKDYTDVACQANLSRSKSHVRYKPGLSSLSHKRLGTKTKTITFYNNKTPIKVLRGQNLEKCGNNCSRYVGMDFSNGELLTVVTYMMNLKESSAQTSLQCHQMLLNIKQEFTKLQSLHHSNLCHYLRWKKISCPDGLLIHVLMEYCGESSLLLQSNKCQMLPLETLRLYTLDLLKTIQYLHENNVAHRNINVILI